MLCISCPAPKEHFRAKDVNEADVTAPASHPISSPFNPAAQMLALSEQTNSVTPACGPLLAAPLS